jgi:hypothetical protein
MSSCNLKKILILPKPNLVKILAAAVLPKPIPVSVWLKDLHVVQPVLVHVDRKTQNLADGDIKTQAEKHSPEVEHNQELGETFSKDYSKRMQKKIVLALFAELLLK